jgi:hypothetical protein
MFPIQCFFPARLRPPPRLAAALALAIAAASFARPVLAQPAAGVDLALSEDWVWRGILRASSWTVQPGVWGRWDFGPHSIAAGGWAGVELGRIEEREVTTAGRRGSRVGEVDAWAQATARIHTLDAGVGAIRYRFRGSAANGGRGPGESTTEIYLLLQPLPGELPVDLKGTLFCDVDRVRGTYLEATASKTLTLIPEPGNHLLSLLLSATAGYDFSQDGPRGNFDRVGVTHVDLAAGITPQVLGSFAVIHHQRSIDPATRRSGAGRSADHRTWVEIGFGHAWGHRRRAR